MHGLHLTADLYGCTCSAHWLTDADALVDACRRAVVAVGLVPVAQLAHAFPATAAGAGGVTATVLLAESHLCVHTWPEQRGVTLDVYVCNFGADHSVKARALEAALVALFVPERTERHSLLRGHGGGPGDTGGAHPAQDTAASAARPAPAQALILAAGRGERMRPLTDHLPKPLLRVQGKPLMQWPMEALARTGVTRLVVNTGWLGDQIEHHFGPLRMPHLGCSLSISYSSESRAAGGALETLGGVVRALPLLDDVFWVAAGDVFAPDFAFDAQALARFRAGTALAHLWLVPNPPHHPHGDFGLGAGGRATDPAAGHPAPRYTFSTIALYRKALFAPPWCDLPAGNPDGVALPLAPLLRAAIAAGQVEASLYTGRWTDVGTPARLDALNR